MQQGGPRAIDTVRVLYPAGCDILEIPHWEGSRLFISKDNWRVLRSSLRLYGTFHWKERVLKAALLPRAVFGRAPLTTHVPPERAGGWALGDLLAANFPRLFTIAVRVGIPGPDRKITIQLMDRRGDVLGFAKYADKLSAQTLIANEAHMLEILPENVGPQLVRFVPFLQGYLLVQTPLPGRAPASRLYLGAAQMRFLERLIRPGATYEVAKHPFIKSLRLRAGERRRSMFEEIVAGLEDAEWPVALSHGDLSPWNMRYWRGECFAFDWEHGREGGLAYLDAPHALIQHAGLVQKSDPRRAKRYISDRLKTFLPAQYGRFAPAVAALCALNMLISWYPPREPDAYERWLTAFVEASI